MITKVYKPFRRTARRLGLDIVRSPNEHTIGGHLAYMLHRMKVDCVLDVGAHVGGYGKNLRLAGYRGPIVSFEPVKENLLVLAENCKPCSPRWSPGSTGRGSS